MTADELTAIRRQMRADDEFTGEMLDELTWRITALEEILAARWPRSILVRARLRRDLRASVRYSEGATFAERRVNAIGTGWLERQPTSRGGTGGG